ncbi:unnamed protein product [Darwinula stevensoni]|uniref:SLC26A/SulP transporter domain-containing protein n=1 Tax=Darwinula stevensoni TaxID=69355 RepID=A0A7R8XJD6_9CRUS|nr:unnamed protein product [Darwinula stevensoni]CAG0894714.1 unnamed protein product [Darwinula stevensoni]
MNLVMVHNRLTSDYCEIGSNKTSFSERITQFMSAMESPFSRPRRSFTQQDLQQEFHYRSEDPITVGEKARSFFGSHCQCSWEKAKATFFSFFPIFYWLPRYNVQRDLLPDIVAGCTVAIMHVPQGLAYALLANLPPIYGIYMAFFPVPIYVLMGTSRHISMGSFAVVTLMTGKVVEVYKDKLDGMQSEQSLQNSTALSTDDTDIHRAILVASAVSLTVGLFQILMGVVQMGRLTVFLSDTLVSAFTTGAAVHVATSQVQHVFGLPLPKHYGPTKLIQTYRDFFPMIVSSNVAALIVSGVTMLVLVLNNDFLKSHLAKMCRFPVPIELICVVIGTGVSYAANLHGNYDLATVGDLPTGLPHPEVPPVWLMREVDFTIQCLVIAIVSYATSISLAKLFARKANYHVCPNQELLAQGAGNAFGAAFGCPPFAASLARSLVQESVGGKTQVASLVSCALLVFILFFLAPLFEALPKCVLAGIILVALRGMFLQVKDLKTAWRVSKLDAFVWVSTFLAVTLIDIDYGLAIGVAASLFSLIWRCQRAYACVLGHIPDMGIYVDVCRFGLAIEEKGIKILHYGAGIHFANRETFQQQVYKLSHLDPEKWRKDTEKRHKSMAARRRKLKARSFSFPVHLEEDGIE